MVKNRKGLGGWGCVAAFVMVLFLAATALGDAGPVVVLDPGHGGSDSGVTGSYGAREKEVALALALELKRQLGGAHDVRLTREGDVSLSLVQRAELANSAHGALLLSLHVGTGPTREANRLSLFVQREKKGEGEVQGGKDGWEGGHRPYVSESQALSAALAEPLASLAGFDDVGIMNVPLAVAKGVRMPVVLIEVGNLTNPQEERRLSSLAHLREVAAALVVGIDAFLSR